MLRLGKVPCSVCCPGLVEVSPVVATAADCAKQHHPIDVLVCVKCGDGICGIGEAYCNCPRDCKVP